jgi:MFS family permease
MLESIRKYAGFRLLMLGTLASSTSFWMYQVSVGWLALILTDSPLFIGLAGFAGGIPMLIFSLPCGVLIDRYSRKMILFAAQLGVLIVGVVFALMVWLDAIEPWSMLVLVFVNGTIMSFTFPTRNAMVPSLVEKPHLANAIALNAAVQNSTRVVGPSLAGVLIALFGVSSTFVIAACLQALATYSTSRLSLDPNLQPKNRAKMWESLQVGLKVVAQSPSLIALIVLALAPTVLVMPYINLMPIFARDELDLGATGLGVMLGSTGFGTVVGALHVARSPTMRERHGMQVIAATLFAVFTMAFALAPSIYLAVPLLFGAGWASAAFLAINQTALQLQVDDEVRGRVMSIYLLTWGVLPLGQLAVGTFADFVGTPLAMFVSCIVALGFIAVISRKFQMT